MKTTKLVIAAGAAALLAACGGGGGGDGIALTPTATAVPASATASVSAWTQFVASLLGTESATPLTMDGISPPTSETDAPLPVT